MCRYDFETIYSIKINKVKNNVLMYFHKKVNVITITTTIILINQNKI